MAAPTFCDPDPDDAGSVGEQEAQGVRGLFTAHRDNYFTTGYTRDQRGEKNQVSFQVSVKFNLTPAWARCSVFFGYTQRSFWDLWSSSSPFEDNNYNPEIFFGYRAHDFASTHWKPKQGWQLFHAYAGVEHESNGLSGPSSRGWNHAFASTRLGNYGFACPSCYVAFTAKAWLPFGYGRDADGGGNPDILDYYGLGELAVEVGYDTPPEVPTSSRNASSLIVAGAMARKGLAAGKGNLRSWIRVRSPWSWLAVSLYAAAFVGYGENLLFYDQRRTTIRLGLALDDRLFAQANPFFE
ncbi:MAG: phospholipase A [Myxococcales bacterium]